MALSYAPGDDLVFQMESGFGLLRVLGSEGEGHAAVWHVLVYQEFYPDVESAEAGLGAGRPPPGRGARAPPPREGSRASRSPNTPSRRPRPRASSTAPSTKKSSKPSAAGASL